MPLRDGIRPDPAHTVTTVLHSFPAVAEPEVQQANQGRTWATLAGLFATLPMEPRARRVRVGPTTPCRHRRRLRPDPRQTVLISGGKMTKALQLARAFHSAGHRVVLVESAKYRLTGHRFSNAVDAFHCVPEPTAPGYAEALLDIVRQEGVDVFVPVSSPAASLPDAVAAQPARRGV